MPVVAMGTRAYLSLPRTQGLTDAHAYIVPISHHLSSLEADEDTWDEIKVCFRLAHEAASFIRKRCTEFYEDFDANG